MPPKQKGKRKATQSEDSSLPTESNASDEVTTLELPFKVHLYLQTKRNKTAQPVFTLNAASVAKAAAAARPVITSPPVLFVVPELTNSSSFSTLSRVPETPTQHITQVVSPRVAVTPITVPTAKHNLSMTSFRDTTIVAIIKTCIKEHIFSKCKFYHRVKHGKYDRRTTATCGQIMNYCSLEADATWWCQIQPVITTTLTNHRNNCIKRLNGRFKGMFLSQVYIPCCR